MPEGIEETILDSISQIGLALSPQEPRLYTVANLQKLHRRRWLSVKDILDKDYLSRYEETVFAMSRSPEWALREISTSMLHHVLGGVVPGYLLNARAWNMGPNNLRIRTHVLGGFDWQGARRPLLAVTQDDPDADKVLQYQVLDDDRQMADWIISHLVRSFSPLANAIAEEANVYEYVVWNFVPELISGYARLLTSKYPRSREVIERRRRYLILSGRDWGLYKVHHKF